MTAPTPATPTVIDLTVPKSKTVNAVVMFGCLVMLAVACYMMWKSDRRLEKSDTPFQDVVPPVAERERISSDNDTAKAKEEYNASACGPDCVQGHTYQRGCIQFVEADASDDTEAV